MKLLIGCIIMAVVVGAASDPVVGFCMLLYIAMLAAYVEGK